jgi:hypothetical protein
MGDTMTIEHLDPIGLLFGIMAVLAYRHLRHR